MRVTSRSPNPFSCKSWESGDGEGDVGVDEVGDDERERVVMVVVAGWY